MPDPDDRAARFLGLHRPGSPLLMPNAWDAGSATVLVELGFEAIATTSSGFAATLGRLDGSLTRDEALAHAAAIAAAVDVPVSADLEDGYADDPDGVAATVRLAAASGLAGCSVEDSRRVEPRIHERALAVERVAAAAEAAHAGPARIALTARAENHLHGVDDLTDTIGRLQAFQEAGADAVFAPGLRSLDDIRSVVASVDLPVSVLLMEGGPTVAELAEVGVARVSVGGAFAYAALGALVEAAVELRDEGTAGWYDRVRVARPVVRSSFRR